MSQARRLTAVMTRRATVEGAGVRLQRVFGAADPRLDPFLLLDDFGSDDPEDYLAGFPWHPHRGIETVTYMLSGEVEHQDSLGNRGVIRPGDVQWMTAGAGIVHQEMPQRAEGRLRGLQLWVNLPAASKMTAPRYREVPAATIPEVTVSPGVRVKVVAGELAGVRGPVAGVVAEPELLDLTLAPGAGIEHETPPGHTVLAYVVDGFGWLDPDRRTTVAAGQLAVLEHGESVVATAADTPFRILLVAGRPLREPVAWRGPIVMSSEAELDLAFRQLADGTFLQG